MDSKIMYYVIIDIDGFLDTLGIVPEKELAWKLIEKDLNEKCIALFDLSRSNSISNYIEEININTDMDQVNFFVYYDYIMNEECSDYSIINYCIEKAPYYNSL